MTCGARAAGRADYDASASLRMTYLSNMYNVPKEREALFDVENGPGQRYDGMSGPADFEIQAESEASARWRLAKRRALRCYAGVRYSAFVDNGIANYLRLKMGGHIDLTRRDHLKLRILYLPNRFRKNYKVATRVGDEREIRFEHAYYSQIRSQLHYMRDWTRNLSAGLQYEYESRSFDNLFQARDRTKHTLMLQADQRLGRKVDLGLAAGYSRAATPTEITLRDAQGDLTTLERNRSFEELLGMATLELKLPRGWKTGLSIDYSTRDFTTEVREDALYYRREDDTWTVGVKLSKKLSRNLTLRLNGLVREKISNRKPALEGAEDEDIGYERYSFGGGVAISF